MFFNQGAPDEEGDWEDEADPTQPQGGQAQVNTTEFYELLEVSKDATTEQIKKAFRKRALKEHPDKGGDPNKFKRLKEAYDTLNDPEKRQLYDEYGEEGVKNGGPPGGGSPFDIFRRGEQGPKKMKPKLVKVEVTLEEVYSGAMKDVTFTRIRPCGQCDATGGKNAKKCSQCSGTGKVVKVMQVGMGMFTQVQQACQNCHQLGVIVEEEDRCKVCQGQRIAEQEKKISVGIDPGVPDGHDYVQTGESDEVPGVMAGDVYARIAILPHSQFQRKGADLIYVKEISLLEALTGVAFNLDHLDGKRYLIATAPGEVLSNKEYKTISRKGMPFYKDSMSHGNLFVDFRVIFPPKGSIYPHQEASIRQAFEYTDEVTQQLVNQSDSVRLEDFSEDLLNPRASGGKGQPEDEKEGEEGGEGVQCQAQ